MLRLIYLLYGLIAYVAFVAAFLYAVGFIADWGVPKGISDGTAAPWTVAVPVDLLLLALFAVQHNVMARPRFKAWWTRFVPQPVERSTFVLVASLLLMVLYWQWRPMPGAVWQVDNPIGRGLLWTLCGLGWATVLYSSTVIDHFELFGLRQVWMYFHGRQPEPPRFSERSIYRWVRHPLMLGFLVAFWSPPTMTVGGLLFAVVTTSWILLSLRLEERDLERYLGEPYREYRERTPMLIPVKWPLREAEPRKSS